MGHFPSSYCWFQVSWSSSGEDRGDTRAVITSGGHGGWKSTPGAHLICRESMRWWNGIIKHAQTCQNQGYPLDTLISTGYPLDIHWISKQFAIGRVVCRTWPCRWSRTFGSQDLALAHPYEEALMNRILWYDLVMTNSLPWKITMLLIGKPSISIRAIFHGKLLVITRRYI